ncbi:VACUOLAR ATP SYNTHASE SUBUNIT F [Encephalitozoon cuniculi GB-M1]|uniref:VACUOLAR ATP SYNTHASE SUBUNIT F n=2 Tax=Encephalitozoon cuniculi TaxID=6035 RepID=Q8SSC3_ENCCU|nr:V-type ATPase subunit F [Encephalitozoon cuniculi GB-M1]AGE95999.1 vacuolar ATP synthase subunit f [Encephalitozoon cuniculi]KMV66394.1 V-type ATPase subunit F [Encephalitozoon cuniculi EcunIII-L]UYI28020.1 vacuolar ATP synthase subunit F [Encephalitozoon cuniculi]CAD26177.1 VACUOLAR ATP SYNTHASE SUBUNIT F [Encephalitozoon cuniculi GB-M1]
MDNRTRIGIIGDEETLTGFLIAGVENTHDNPNLIQVASATSEDDLRRAFYSLTSREDLAIVLVCDFAAEKLKDEIDTYKEIVPAILVIASKNKYT